MATVRASYNAISSAVASLRSRSRATPARVARPALLSGLLRRSPHPRSLAVASAAVEGAAASMASLEEAGIIPDVIDRISAASQAELEVVFPHGHTVKNGETIAPKDASQAPKATIKGGSEGGLFTIICTDPDAPDPKNPIRREWLHWVVTNVPAGGQATQGNELTSYYGPAPPIGTHRYIFLLYQQANQEPIQASDPSGGDMSKRPNFSTRKWAAQHNLGDPVACTWFNSHK